MIQGSDEWFNTRLGKVTASRISDVLMKPSTAGYRNYRAQLVAERMTGQLADSFTSAAMERGTELEPDARNVYEFITGNNVEQIAFIDHPTISTAGCSPDGMIGAHGLVEIKCPNTANHIDYLLEGVAPKQYINQMQWQMACTGRDWCDFVSYDPRLQEDNQLFIVRVERDQEHIDNMENEVVKFLNEVDEIIIKLTNRKAA